MSDKLNLINFNVADNVHLSKCSFDITTTALRMTSSSRDIYFVYDQNFRGEGVVDGEGVAVKDA